MEFLFVLLVLGGGVYWFFNGNIRRGAEIMRANLFLTALEHGKSVMEANGLAAQDMSELPPKFVYAANARATKIYGGVRSAMVGDAYRLGMVPKVPAWERAAINATYKSATESMNSAGVFEHVPTRSFPSTLDEYYAVYIAELRLLSGLRPDEQHPVEFLEGTADSVTKDSFDGGVDPRQYAATVHAALERLSANAAP